MVKKRLSKEYMELLRRNQNSVMTVGLAQPCLVLPPPRQEDLSKENHNERDHEPQVNEGHDPQDYETTVVTDQINLEQENIENVKETEDGFIDYSNEPKHEVEQSHNTEAVDNDNCIDLENNQEVEVLGENVSEQTDCDKRNMIKAYLRRTLQTERQEARLPTPTRRRRREVSYPVTSSSFQRLMAIVRSERDKHRQMINMVTNTSFALSRRPLVTKSKYLEKRKRTKFEPKLGSEDEDATRDKFFEESKQSRVEKSDVKSSRSVHFGTLVTFDDNSTPVPIRPPRKKTLRIPAWVKRSKFRGYKTTTPAVSLRRKTFLRKESDEELGEAPEKPARIYKGRGATPVTEALRPIVRHQYQSSLGECHLPFCYTFMVKQ